MKVYMCMYTYTEICLKDYSVEYQMHQKIPFLKLHFKVEVPKSQCTQFKFCQKPTAKFTLLPTVIFLLRYSKIHDFDDQCNKRFLSPSTFMSYEIWNILTKREKLMFIFSVYTKAFNSNCDNCLNWEKEKLSICKSHFLYIDSIREHQAGLQVSTLLHCLTLSSAYCEVRFAQCLWDKSVATKRKPASEKPGIVEEEGVLFVFTDLEDDLILIENIFINVLGSFQDMVCLGTP